jgi:HEAT repeat protein
VKITHLLPGTLVCLALGLAWSPQSVAQEGTDDDLIQMVITFLNDTDKDVRALGFEQVRTAAKGPAATEQFAALLPKLSRDAQVGLLSALADRGDRVARPAVLDLLRTSKEEAVKLAAIGALGSLGEGADVQTLIQLLRDGSSAEQAAARASLVRLPDAAAAGLIAAEMNQAPAPLRVVLLEILAARRALDTMPDILTAAVASDASVRTAAMVALGQLAGPEQLPGLVQGVLKAEAGREREAAEKAVMLVCNRVADKEQRAKPLLDAMGALNNDDRMAMLPTLGRIGGAAALQAVEAAIGDANPKLHDAGLRALCNWPDASISSRLIELAGKDAHADHQTRAIRALIRVASLPDGRKDAEKLELLRTAMTACTRDAERNLVLQRASAIRIPETLRFLVPYLDQPAYAQQACLAVVELAHHRDLREANKAEFDRALDKVIQISKDATVVERANRYKKNQTWVRPRESDQTDQ